MATSTGLCVLLFVSWIQLSEALVPEGCDGKMDLVFVMDHSESIRDNDPPRMPFYNWHHYTNFTKRLIQNLPVETGDTKVAVVKFGDDASLEFDLNQYPRSWDAQNAVSKMSFDGGRTNTYSALRMTNDEVFFPHPGDRHTYRNVIVLMTDGMPNVYEKHTQNEADRAKASGAEIFTIAISNEIDAGELRKLASDGEKHFIHVNKFDKLEDYIRLVTHRLCGLPDPLPEPERPEDCEMRMDLCFLIDVSGSITDKNPSDKSYDNYDLLRQFIKDMIALLEVGRETTRISAIKFSDYATLLFNLDKYYTKQEMFDAIDNMGYDGAYTNTSGAIRLMRSGVFRRELGDRGDARNVGVLITDGESSKDPNMTIPEATLAKEAGIALFVVGVTNEIHEKEAREIASNPDSEYYFNTTDIRSLQKIKNQLVKHVCTPESHINRVARSVNAEPKQRTARSVDSGHSSAWSSMPSVFILSVSFLIHVTFISQHPSFT